MENDILPFTIPSDDTIREKTPKAEAILLLADATKTRHMTSCVLIMIEVYEAICETQGVSEANAIMALIASARVPSDKK